jgi:Cu-Zn family superoxide dismutase
MAARTRIAVIFLASSPALAACGDSDRGASGGPDTGFAGGPVDTPGFAQDTPAAAIAANSASAAMRDAAGRELGTLTLSAGGQGITVAGRLTGLPPGVRAIHLHAVGRCDPPSFESAGEHWNPTNRSHGFEWPQGPHLGDLRNISVATDSSVEVQATTPGGMIKGNQELLDGDGATVVIHTGPDDYETQPSGGSGDRIACGVVTGTG